MPPSANISASKADFVGAIRLPSDAFKREGTAVVTDIVFLRKRAPGEPARHADPDWLGVAPLAIEGAEVPINRYFLNHPEMVLGTWSRKDTLYGGEGYSVTGNGDLAGQLKEAIGRLPAIRHRSKHRRSRNSPPRPSRRRRRSATSAKAVSSSAMTAIICQSQGGQGVPVVYGGTTLRADGTLTGKRLAALVGLRDRARRVLQSQNEGWPEANRDEARRELNWAYDRFVARLRPDQQDHLRRNRRRQRHPPHAQPREVPGRPGRHAGHVAGGLRRGDRQGGQSRHHDEGRGRQDPAHHARSEAPRKGCSSPSTSAARWICRSSPRSTASPKSKIIAELGDLIFPDPESKTWQTADAYLSGNVRAKLAAAERAGPDYARNAEALRAVQPEDVLPGDIDANLGAPWIPESDIQAFAADLFHVEPSSRPGRPPEERCRLEPRGRLRRQASVAATSEFGTPRANGTWLLELALNMKTPIIYDTIMNGDREERVVNQEATLAAREKQKLIKERFRSWVFADPDRTERLVRLYNDTYNNLRPRLFDGSHLDFPGMNQTIKLRPHQNDAVWRGMSSGNTLLAHAVGAGKTFTMAATGMKMKQAGLIKKPMYVVPNHLLEQFAREFMQLYPNAKLLVAAKEDLTPRPPQVPDRQDRQRRVGRHHRHPSAASSGSACRGTIRRSSCASRSPNTTSCCANMPAQRVPTATSSRPSRSRRPREANA